MAGGEVFEYKGYRIPVALMQLTGGAPDDFDICSRIHMDLLEQLAGLSPEMKVLEIGCGIGRDAIPLAEKLSPRGSYLGIDVCKEQIAWCAANISTRHPNFAFVHFDVYEKFYNPTGVLGLAECRIPVPSGSVDRIVLQSVFTHMTPSDVGHYFGEFARILKPDGRVFSTFFIMTEEAFAAQQPGDTLFFHEAESGFYIVDPDYPTKTVAYSEARIRALLDESRLDIVVGPIIGDWTGAGPIRAQDILILGRYARDRAR